MLVCLLIIGSLGSVPNPSPSTSMAIGVMLVLMTLCNMMTVGPVAYPIVSEIPSGRLRYKTIVIGRMAYLFTQIFTNSMTPKMIQPVVAGGWGWRAKAGFFYAGTNILCLTWCWFRLPETKASRSANSHLIAIDRVCRTGRLVRSMCCSKTRCRPGSLRAPRRTVRVALHK